MPVTGRYVKLLEGMTVGYDFAMVEIAIVLVIVGLLIGGVLKGQEMITNAKIKRIESDNAGISAAMFSYQDRYLQLPGDDDDAQSRFDTLTAAADNGNNNGLIGGDWDSLTVTDETVLFWRHLRAAGLVPGGAADTTQPSNAYGGKIGVHDGALGIGGHVLVFGALEGAIGRILEARLDDTFPHSGRVRAETTNLNTINTAPATQPAAGTYLQESRYNIAFRL